MPIEWGEVLYLVGGIEDEHEREDDTEVSLWEDMRRRIMYR